MKNVSYVDLLLAEWEIDRCPGKLQTCMRRVLGELAAEAQLFLRKNPKLQVVILPKAPFSIWAYFPVHARRTIVRHLGVPLNRTARVLLVLDENQLQQQSARKTNAQLRHHLGHVLLYLAAPKKPNECEDALRQWQESVRVSQRV